MAALGTQLEILAEVFVAMLLGGLIGLEREVLHKPAGFRTHMLVSGAAALLVGLGDAAVVTFAGNLAGSDVVRTDPTRILQAIITGISFLGAGTIFRGGRRGPVGGLTTAASLLFAAGVGIAIALREWLIGIAVTLLVLVVLRGLRGIEAWLARRGGPAP